MSATITDPYAIFPALESARFTLRLVREEDAPDLLACYSDPLALPIFNSDNCTSDFHFQTLDEMQECIGFWTESYARRYFVRLSIVEKSSGKAVGTLEFFARPETFPGFGKLGVLRLDLVSRLEDERTILEILRLVRSEFYAAFSVANIVTKAVPQAAQRLSALKQQGFMEFDAPLIIAYPHYFISPKDSAV